MPKRSRTAKPTTLKKRPARHVSKAHQQEQDENQSAFAALQRVIELTEGTGGKNPLAVALGRLGGLKGGRARAATMTPAERSKSAKKAARARWDKEIG